MNDQNMHNDKLQIALDQLRGDIDHMNENQDKVNEKLLSTTENYD